MLPTATGYAWNGTRYYDLETGRFVSMSAVRDALESVIDASAIRMNNLSQDLVNGTITLAQWENGMMANIKTAHVAATAAANGGWAQVSQSDWGAAGQLIREQYEYLRNFAGQIADGTQGLDGRLLVRSDMYGDASRDTFEAIRQRRMIADGFEEERGILEPGVDHCDGCLERAEEEWQPIGTLLPIGDAECATRCHCTMEYRRRDINGEWEEVE
jgi:hypothetical protein